MTRDMIVPLESYRLARYVVPIPCYICEEENTFDAEYCRHCLAPMALAHQAASQKVQARMVAAVGATAVGKTVFLGMLIDMLSRRPDQVQLLARGAFSITLQETTLAALARCQFPQKTPNEPDRWNWVHCQLRRNRQQPPMELIVPDMAGEAILEEVVHPRSFRVITAYLKKCAGAMLLVDAIKLKEGASDQEYFTMKLISYMAELCEDPKQDWSQRPVALIFTKADQCEECVADPAGFAASHASRLWRLCQERFHVHQAFAAGVAGACAWRETGRNGRVRVPLRVEPFGIVEPFLWLLGKLEAQRPRAK
ncbi:MAG: TRAFAC clade GTPase domain-containing protein [Thermoguttaceae bacterium]